MTGTEHAPGWDAAAIRDVANNRFGGYAEMFEAFGWPERGSEMMRVVQKHVANRFGSVQKFVDIYREQAAMPPLEAIQSDPPNVWLSSGWGFEPEEWGCITFPTESMLNSFLRRSEPGCLMVLYDTGRKNPDQRHKVRGVLRSTHEIARTEDMLTPQAWRAKQNDPRMKDRWLYAVKIDGAWAITRETRPDVDEFANETYSTGRGQVIGSQGMPLTSSEARKLLTYDYTECDIARTNPIVGTAPTSAAEIFTPSRAGPVSKNPYSTREAEGPKHIYILSLSGDADTFLDRATNGKRIFKVGISRSPQSRCEGLNAAFPKGAFTWSVCRSTFDDGRPPCPDSATAINIEDKLKVFLTEQGTPLGGEFFLADEEAINTAWVQNVGS